MINMLEDGKLQLIESAENKNSKTSYLALFKIMEYIKTTQVKVSLADILQTIEVVCCTATENKLKHLRNLWVLLRQSFPGGSGSEESACNAGRPRFNPLVGKIPGEGNVNLLQYSCLENSMDRGAWQATVHGITKSRTWLSD